MYPFSIEESEEAIHIRPSLRVCHWAQWKTVKAAARLLQSGRWQKLPETRHMRWQQHFQSVRQNTFKPFPETIRINSQTGKKVPADQTKY